MCLRYSFGRVEDAALLEKAVERVLAEGYRTGDIMQPGMNKVGTDGDDGRDPEGAGETVRLSGANICDQSRVRLWITTSIRTRLDPVHLQPFQRQHVLDFVQRCCARARRESGFR